MQSLWYSGREFLKEREISTTISTFSSSVNFFRQNKFEADQETRKPLGGYGGMVPRKIFGNLHAVMAILAIFE